MNARKFVPIDHEDRQLMALALGRMLVQWKDVIGWQRKERYGVMRKRIADLARRLDLDLL